MLRFPNVKSAALIALLLALFPRIATAGELARSLPVGNGETLRIEVENGRIDVITQAVKEFRIEATARGLGASAMEFRLQREGDVWVLSERPAPWLDWITPGPRVAVRVWVPYRSVVEIAGGAPVVLSNAGIEVTHPARARDEILRLEPIPPGGRP